MSHFKANAIAILVVTTWAALTAFAHAEQPRPIKSSFYHPNDGPPVRFVPTWPGPFFDTRDLSTRKDKFYETLRFYKILEPHTQHAHAYLVAKHAGAPLGWVPTEDGFLWNTRQGFDERLEDGNVASELEIPVFRDKDGLTLFLENDPNAPEPFAIARQSGAVWMKSPVVGFELVYPNGEAIKAFKVQVVCGREAAKREASPVEPPHKPMGEWLDSLFRLDICFVQDVTQSLAAYKGNFSSEIVKLISQVRGRYEHVDLRVGWSVYRDKDVVGPDGQHKECVPAEFLGQFSINKDNDQKHLFEREIKETKVLTTGSYGEEETVFAGIATALDQFGWRDGALRILVVCGDAPNHPAKSDRNVGGHTISSIVDKLDKCQVVPFAIFPTHARIRSGAGEANGRDRVTRATERRSCISC